MNNTQTSDAFLEHFGVKGMRWGQRKAKRQAKKAAAKAAYDKQYKEFTAAVLKDVGSRSPSELYAVRGSTGRTVMTGEEFLQRVNMGMRFSEVTSTGQTINDGR